MVEGCGEEAGGGEGLWRAWRRLEVVSAGGERLGFGILFGSDTK